MSRATRKEFRRSIGHSFGRFLAIALISFLGAGVFAGLRMAAPDLRDSADEYFDATNLYDVMVVSTLGFDDESLASIASIQGVEAVMPGYSMDAVLSCAGESFAASVQSLPAAAAASDTSDGSHAFSDEASYLNRPLLVAGNWPEAADECVMGREQAQALGIEIGDMVRLVRTQGNRLDVFAVNTLRVTGFVLSSAFCSDVQLGTTQLGDGTIDAYVYVPEAAFNAELPFTTIYATVADARAAHWGTAAYDKAVAGVVARIRAAAADITHARNEAIRGAAQGELDEARATFQKEKADSQKALSDARGQLENTHEQLVDAVDQLEEARAQLLGAQARLLETKTTLESGEDEYDKRAAELKAQREQAATQLATLPQLRTEREQLAKDPTASASALADLDSRIQQLEQLQAQLTSGEEALAATRTQLDASWKQYNEGLTAYEKNLANYEKAVSQYEEGKEAYDSGLDELTSQEQEAQSGFDDAERKFTEAQADIDSLEPTEVFVADRTKNVGAAAREHDAQSVQQIATYLPYVFILVAVLVVLTSMMRMVDEERMVIGTHKALGYGKGTIAVRYLAYGTLASGLGSVAGVLMLGKLLPWFILSSYAINYSIPFMPLEIYPSIAAEAVGITVGVAFVATWVAVSASLHERPAALMLPRVPKAGKRILLERMGFIWRHVSFSHKVTARNLLRYKPRFFMAVIGVAGCTALLVVGFGMRDVISDIVTNQYDELVTYDAQVVMADGAYGETVAGTGTTGATGAEGAGATGAGTTGAGTATTGNTANAEGNATASTVSSVDSERAALRQALAQTRIARLFSQQGIESYQFVYDSNMIASVAGKASDAGGAGSAGGARDDLRVEVIVPSAVDELGDYITLRDRTTHEPITLDDETIVLSEKAATELGVQVGDTIALYNENLVADKMGEGYVFTVGGITENYLQHYVYMTPALYQAVMGSAPTYSTVFLNFESDADVSTIVDTLLARSAVSSVALMSQRIDNYVEMLDIMNKLIVVILLLAAALAFVVLYNLTNININERVREIATLKVLGFTRHEVNLYIFREIFIMVLIGAVVGCVIGSPLTLSIATAAETADMMFGREIEPVSFVYAFVITLVFAWVIAFFMRPKLAHVNMVESLKSVD